MPHRVALGSDLRRGPGSVTDGRGSRCGLRVARVCHLPPFASKREPGAHRTAWRFRSALFIEPGQHPVDPFESRGCCVSALTVRGVPTDQPRIVSARALLALQPPCSSTERVTASGLEAWLLKEGLAERNGESGQLVPTDLGRELGAALVRLG